MKSSANAEDFENLVRNGLDFLEKAISQLAAEPKHSVINFYTAVEIFLKAPLVLDHWSLVHANGDRNREKYESGDFVSVSFEE
ncbi:hsdR, partial [Klebsiella pneumoniae]|nr:hsdR [Klebsiella pneumoniae]